MRIYFKGDFFRMSLDVQSRTEPDSEDYTAANTLQAEVDVQLPGCHCQVAGTLHIDEILGLYKRLKRLHETGHGAADLMTRDEWLWIQGDAGEDEKVSWRGKLEIPVDGEASLRFAFDSDRSDVPETLQELDAALRAFPMKGAH